MNKKSQLQFAQRCAVLLESGISLTEVISIVIKMEKSKKRARILTGISQHIEKGTSLAKSINTTKAKFDPALVSMIAYGESAGILPLSLRQASEIMERKSELQKKIIGSLVYPLFIGIATIIMTLFLVMYIFPKILPLLSSLNITLPLLTRIVKKLYEILVQWGIWIGLAFMGTGLIAYFFYKKSYKFRYFLQKTTLYLPLINELIKKYFISTYCHSAGTLLEYGQPLPSILSEGTISCTFEPYKKAWSQSRNEISRGVALSECIRSKSELYPSVVADMISIGERTGTLAGMFGRIGKMFEEEIETFIKYFSTIIEPVLMIGMGIIVGSVALSIILPIYEITNHLGH